MNNDDFLIDSFVTVDYRLFVLIDVNRSDAYYNKTTHFLFINNKTELEKQNPHTAGGWMIQDQPNYLSIYNLPYYAWY